MIVRRRAFPGLSARSCSGAIARDTGRIVVKVKSALSGGRGCDQAGGYAIGLKLSLETVALVGGEAVVLLLVRFGLEVVHRDSEIDGGLVAVVEVSIGGTGDAAMIRSGWRGCPLGWGGRSRIMDARPVWRFFIRLLITDVELAIRFIS